MKTILKFTSPYLIFIVIISLTTFLLRDLSLGHDSFAHLTYAKLFYQALSEGQFPVRWTEGARGLGQPLFNFYQVGFYYLFSLIHFLIPNFILAIKITILILWWTGSFFIFLLTKRFGTLPASFAVLIYTFSPYLLLDIFIRASYPEFTAISLMPAVFYFLDKLLNTAKTIYLPFLTLFFGFALISHIPALVIFTPILLGYILLLISQKAILKAGIIKAVLGIVLGGGLASFYLLPALGEINLIQIERLTWGDFNFYHNFVNPKEVFSYIWGYGKSWKGSPEFTFLIGVPQILILTGSFVSLIILPQFKKHYLDLLFWFMVFIYILFFSQIHSLPLWEKLRFLSFIQFPWRFFMLTPILSAFLGAAIFSLLSLKKKLIILLITLSFIVIFLPFLFSSLPPLKADIFNLPYRDLKEHPLYYKKAYFEPGYNPKKSSGFLFQRDQSQNKGEVFILKKETKQHLMVFNLKANEPSILILSTYYFPNWRAYLDNRETLITPDPEGYLTLNIPSGSHILTLKFTDSYLRFLGNQISLFSLTLTILILILIIFKKLTLPVSYKILERFLKHLSKMYHES